MNTKNSIYKTATRGMVALGAAALMLAAGCKKDFQVPAHSTIDADVLWTDEGSVQYFLNGTYAVIMPDYPYEASVFLQEFASDENIGSATDGTLKKVMGIGDQLLSTDVKIIAQKYQGTKGDNRYYDIARCNQGIDYIPTSPFSELSKRKMLGQFYMLRAMGYFEIVKLYGGVPLILRTQNPANLDNVGRSSAKDCINQIVKDLDSAAVKLDGITWNDATERGKLTKLAALCYKAKVLLYWASPQFNPVNDGVHTYDATRWTRALDASKAAYDACVASNIKLMPDYSTIFQTEGTSNTEAIIVRSYSTTLEKRGNNVESKSRPGGLTGGAASDYYVATQRMLDAYGMADGTPISQAGTTYDSYMFWKNRDPRFAQTIAYNGSTWKLNGITGRRQWTYNKEIEGSTKPFYCKRFSAPDLAAASVAIVADKGGNGFDWIELRFAEVILNYADCLNETGDITTAKNMVRMIRQRAGITNTSGKDYGLSYATDKASMRDLIANERMVEFAFEGKRGWDLRRTRKFHELSGYLTVQGESISTVNTATKTSQLETVDGNGVRGRDKLNMDDATVYANYFTRNLIFGNNTQGISISEKQCYFYPLPSQFLLSSPLLDQTLGWDNGTFDPLK